MLHNSLPDRNPPFPAPSSCREPMPVTYRPGFRVLRLLNFFFFGRWRLGGLHL